MGDEDARRLVRSHRCISVDGCTAECAKKNLELSDAKLAANFIVMDILREHRNLRTQGVTCLDENGRKLAKILAEKIASRVEELNQEDAAT